MAVERQRVEPFLLEGTDKGIDRTGVTGLDQGPVEVDERHVLSLGPASGERVAGHVSLAWPVVSRPRKHSGRSSRPFMACERRCMNEDVVGVVPASVNQVAPQPVIVGIAHGRKAAKPSRRTMTMRAGTMMDST